MTNFPSPSTKKIYMGSVSNKQNFPPQDSICGIYKHTNDVQCFNYTRSELMQSTSMKVVRPTPAPIIPQKLSCFYQYLIEFVPKIWQISQHLWSGVKCLNTPPTRNTNNQERDLCAKIMDDQGVLRLILGFNN
jgi:hypothetical protein